MAYIPNPTDGTQPTGNVDASTADDEFRALKTYIQGLVLGGGFTGMFSPVRQAINDGFADGSGFPSFLTAAAAGGLALDLKATGRPLVANFAGGGTGTGTNDRLGTYTGDVASVVAGLAALSTNFIFADYVSAGVWTWQSGLVPPQYGIAFDRSKQSLLRFAGADASTSILDDYGNTWAAVGNAQIDTAVQIDGLNTLLLDGTGDYVECLNIQTLGSGSWTIEAKVRFNALPAAATHIIFEFLNASTFGLVLGLNDTAGVKKLSLFASSTGGVFDIFNGTGAPAGLGTSTVWATGTTYHIVVTYDALSGKYFLYKDGVLDFTGASALRIAALTRVRLGDGVAVGFANLNGAIAGFRYGQLCRYPNGVGFVAPSIATFAVEGDFFDIQAMKMYSVTAASVVAQTNPTLTSKYRMYFGEADTSAIIPTALRSYAFNGRAYSADLTLVSGAAIPFNHNLGVIPEKLSAFLKNVTADAGYAPGDIVAIGSNYENATNAYTTSSNRNTMQYVQSAVATIGLKTTGARSATVLANWRLQLQTSRGWGGA